MQRALDPNTGDLLVRNHRTVLIDGIDYAKQKVAIILRFLLGEWFLDGSLGLIDISDGSPWYARRVNIAARRADVIRALNVPEVVSIKSVDVAIDSTDVQNPQVEITVSVVSAAGPFDLTVTVPLP